MALEETMKSDILELLKAASPGGMSKDDVTEMLNGLDKKWGKEQQKIAQTLESLGGFAKAFEGIKPKKLMKAMKKAGKVPKEPKPGDDNKVKLDADGKPVDGKDPQFKDPYADLAKKKVKKLEERITQIEKEKVEVVQAAERETRLAAIRSNLSGLPWSKSTAQELAFQHYAGLVEREPKTNKLVIKLPDETYAEFTKEFATQDVANQFDFALLPPEARGAGITSAGARKPGTITLDDDLSDPKVAEAFAKAVSKMLPAA